VSPRGPLLPMLASLTAHGGAVALLAFASGESLPSGLFIVLSELEPAAIASGPRQARASAGPPATPAASPAAPRPSPLASATAAAVAPLPAPAPTTPPEREVPPAPTPARDPERVAEVSVIREESATDAARSAPSPSAVAGATGSDLARGGAASDGGAGRGTAQHSASVGGGEGGTNVAVAPSGSDGGEPGSEYGGYYARIRQRIQESLRYPSVAQRRGLMGTVHLEILIRPDGAIGNVSVAASSSHRLLDEAALETVRSLSPQPFPANLRPRWLTVRLPVVFDLQ